MHIQYYNIGTVLHSRSGDINIVCCDCVLCSTSCSWTSMHASNIWRKFCFSEQQYHRTVYVCCLLLLTYFPKILALASSFWTQPLPRGTLASSLRFWPWPWNLVLCNQRTRWG